MLPSSNLWTIAMASSKKRIRKSPRKPRVVKGTPDVTLTRAEFERRFRVRFHDPAFARLEKSVESLGELAWQAYEEYRKSPSTAPAGFPSAPGSTANGHVTSAMT